MAMRKPGVYAPLSANYADDERIMEAGEDAELMYVRMLAYAARTPLTEGWISDRVILSRLGILPRESGNGAGTEPGTDAGSRTRKLAEVGLIVRDGDGYRIAGWLKWNKSAEEMGRERVRDLSRKRAATSSDDGTDAGTGAGNDAGVPDPMLTADQNTDQKQITTRARRSTSEPAGFAEWYALYPRKEARPKAAAAFRAALKRTDIETLTLATKQYAAKRHGQDPQYTALPASWLNADRWADEATPVSRPVVYDQWRQR